MRQAAIVLVVTTLIGCGGPAESAEATSTGGGEQGDAVTRSASPVHIEPPAPTVELNAGQASASPTAAAVALAAVTSHAEPLAEIRNPVRVSPKIYKIISESTRMRLLVATWQPGQSDAPHGHPPTIIYAITDIEGLSTGESGKQKSIKLRAGAAFYQNPEKSHTFKNVGSQSARMLLLELSQRVDPMPMPSNASPDALASSPDVYKRVFEDEHVRVLLATWAPGKMDEMHSHPEMAAYALTPINAKLHGVGGDTHDLSQPAGGGVFQDPVKGHMYENSGDAITQMVLFEPKGGASRASAAAASSFARLPVESGDGEVTTCVDALTGVKMDIGSGFTLEVPPGVEFSDVVSLSITGKRPKNEEVAPGFSRHAQTLMFDGVEESLAKQVLLGMTIAQMPVMAGKRFVLAMEVSGDCTAKAKHRLPSGGCAHWEIIPTLFDETRKKVIARLGATGGYRLQFGWLPE